MSPAHEDLMQQHLRNESLPEAVMPACPTNKPRKGQKAVVTGANYGIGQAIALAHAGVDVVVNYVSRPDAAVNPTLTIIVNALRVGEHLVERLGARMNVAASSVTQQSRAHIRLPVESACLALVSPRDCVSPSPLCWWARGRSTRTRRMEAGVFACSSYPARCFCGRCCCVVGWRATSRAGGRARRERPNRALQVLNMVAEPVQITGEVEGQGELLILCADSANYHRVPQCVDAPACFRAKRGV